MKKLGRGGGMIRIGYFFGVEGDGLDLRNGQDATDFFRELLRDLFMTRHGFSPASLGIAPK